MRTISLATLSAISLFALSGCGPVEQTNPPAPNTNAAAAIDSQNSLAKSAGGSESGASTTATSAVPADASATSSASAKSVTPQDILARINGIREKRPSNNEEEFRKYLEKTEPDLARIAASAMAMTEIDDETYLQLVRSRLESLAAAAILNDPAAAAQIDSFVEEMEATRRVAAIEEARHFQVAWKFSRAKENATNEAELTRACQGVVAHALAATNPDKSHASLAFEALQLLEFFGETETVLDAHTRLALAFHKSDDANLATRFENAAKRLALIGNPIEIQGQTLAGESIDMSKYKGKVLLVDFWATWCPPCIAEIPNLRKHYDQYHAKGFEVLGVSLDDDREKLEAFLTAKKIPWPTVFETDWAAQGWKNPNAVRYRITSVPSAILVDQQGRVLTFHARGERLGQLLEQLLGPTGEAASPQAASLNPLRR